MTRSIPLIRAVGMFPALRWAAHQGLSPDAVLKEAGLQAELLAEPMRPVPLLRAGEVLQIISRQAGPDTPCRIIDSAPVIEIALLGRVALGTKTPLEALGRIVSALPFFCSHESLSVEQKGDSFVIHHGYLVRFPEATEHLMLQYAVAMADKLCGMTSARFPRFQALEIQPHPEFGVEHLRKWFGDNVKERSSRSISIWIGRDLGEKRFSKIARDRGVNAMPKGVEPLRMDKTLTTSVRLLLQASLDFDLLSVGELAHSGGMSARTFQRRLHDEGTSYSIILSEVRRKLAQKQLSLGQENVSQIAAQLGFSRQASLTRAMRRWTGKSPTQFRERGRMR